MEGRRLPADRPPHRPPAADPSHGAAGRRDKVESGRPACRRCGAILSTYRAGGKAEGLCAACAAREAPQDEWRVLEPEDLALAVAGVLASAAADTPGERVHVQSALEARGILSDHIDVRLAAERFRRRHGWHVAAVEGRPGHRLIAWPFRFGRNSQRNGTHRDT